MEQKPWIVFGVSSVAGREFLEEALKRRLDPILGDHWGQPAFEVARKVGKPLRIFDLTDSKKIEPLLQGISLIVVCQTLEKSLHEPLLKACLATGTHYIDIVSDLFTYRRVKIAATHPRKKTPAISLLPGLHRSVILSDLLVSQLKKQFPNASDLTIAISESFSSINMMMRILLSGGRIIVDNHLRRPESAAESLLVPFRNSGSALTVTSPMAALLTAWVSTRIPNIKVFRLSTAHEIRFLRLFRLFRWILHVPFVKQWLSRQENFLIKHFSIRPFYTQRVAVWARATNRDGKTLTAELEALEDNDLGHDLAFEAMNRLWEHTLPAGLLTPSRLLSLEELIEERKVSLALIP